MNSNELLQSYLLKIIGYPIYFSGIGLEIFQIHFQIKKRKYGMNIVITNA